MALHFGAKVDVVAYERTNCAPTCKRLLAQASSLSKSQGADVLPERRYVDDFGKFS